MTDTLEISSGPYDEEVAQVGSPDYDKRSRAETKAFIAQLRRVFGQEPEGARLKVKSSPHDFGSYREVVCDFSNSAGSKYCYEIEGNTPAEWDAEARTELAVAGFGEPVAPPIPENQTPQALKDLINSMPGGTVLAYQDEEPEGSLHLGHFDRHTKGPYEPTDFFLPDLLEGSDYSGGSYTLANKKVFLDNYGEIPGVHEVYGSHGTYGVAIKLATLADSTEIQETLAGLTDYPVINDEAVSEVEMEAENEAWSNWAEGDFKKALTKRLGDELSEALDTVDPDNALDLVPEDLAETAIADLNKDKLYDLFREAMDTSNTYWEHEEGNNATVDIDRVVKAVDGLDVMSYQILRQELPAELSLGLTAPVPSAQMKLPGLGERKRKQPRRRRR